MLEEIGVFSMEGRWMFGDWEMPGASLFQKIDKGE